jgi:uncharacterized protein (TIGR03067 family)
MYSVLIAIAMGVGSGGGRDGATDTRTVEKSREERLQGTWRAVLIEFGGMEYTAKELGLVMTIQGNTVTMSVASKPEENGEWTFLLGPDKGPTAIDFRPEGKGGKGDRYTLKRIYVLKGDTVRECYCHESKVRPKEFNSKDGQTIMTWKR